VASLFTGCSHHWRPKQILQELPLIKETFKVFPETLQTQIHSNFKASQPSRDCQRLIGIILVHEFCVSRQWVESSVSFHITF